MGTKTTGKKLDLEGLIKEGENPKGFTAQTANGTAKCYGTGWNKDFNPGPMPEVPEGGAWQGPNSNRTGE